MNTYVDFVNLKNIAKDIWNLLGNYDKDAIYEDYGVIGFLERVASILHIDIGMFMDDEITCIIDYIMDEDNIF